MGVVMGVVVLAGVEEEDEAEAVARESLLVLLLGAPRGGLVLDRSSCAVGGGRAQPRQAEARSRPN